MSFTRVVGPGIHTQANIDSHNIHSSGIITATKFDGPFDSINVSGTTVRFMVSSLSTGSWDYLRHCSVVQSSGSITFAFNYQTS